MARPKRKGKKGRTLPRVHHVSSPRPIQTGESDEPMLLGTAPRADVETRERFGMREGQHLAPITVAAQGRGGTVTIGDAPNLTIPTVALVSICLNARDENMEHLIDKEIGEKLAPNGRHYLHSLRRVVNEDGSDFIRARVMLQLRDRSPGKPYETLLDFPTRYIGMLIDAAAARREKAVAEPSENWRWTGKKPTWAGSYSYDLVWQQAESIAVKVYDHPDRQHGERRVAPRHLLALSALTALQEAHLVRVEPEQVSVLPDWDDMSNLWDYSQDVILPFEKIYLDFEGVGHIAPVVKMTPETTEIEGEPFMRELHVDMQIRGALVWRDTSGRLSVTVVGWPIQWGMDGMVNMMAGQPDQPRWSEYEICGSMTFGAGPGSGEARYEFGTTGIFAMPLTMSTRELTRDQLEGFVSLPVDLADVDRVRRRATAPLASRLSEPIGVKMMVAGWSTVVLWGAARALAALSILEAEEVEIVEAPIEVRDKKRALKRGWPIAKIVQVRPRRKYLSSNPPSGEEAHYSHRFWVRAHVKHFPLGTRVADARPDLCKPCHRCGTCRRVNTKAHIRGPEDKPLVPKSLVVRKEKPREVHLPERLDERPYYKAPEVV